MAEPADKEAIYANIAAMTVTTHGIRLSFGETVGNDKQEFYRVSVYLPMEVARNFRALVEDALDQHAAFNEATKSARKRRKAH